MEHRPFLRKKVQTKYGEVTIETPRDRDGTFQPETVKNDTW